MPYFSLLRTNSYTPSGKKKKKNLESRRTFPITKSVSFLLQWTGFWRYFFNSNKELACTKYDDAMPCKKIIFYCGRKYCMLQWYNIYCLRKSLTHVAFTQLFKQISTKHRYYFLQFLLLPCLWDLQVRQLIEKIN